MHNYIVTSQGCVNIAQTTLLSGSVLLQKECSVYTGKLPGSVKTQKRVLLQGYVSDSSYTVGNWWELDFVNDEGTFYSQVGQQCIQSTSGAGFATTWTDKVTSKKNGVWTIVSTKGSTKLKLKVKNGRPVTALMWVGGNKTYRYKFSKWIKTVKSSLLNHC